MEPLQTMELLGVDTMTLDPPVSEMEAFVVEDEVDDVTGHVRMVHDR